MMTLLMICHGNVAFAPHQNLENGATTGETDDNMNKSESGSNDTKIQP
jgi:hypothetical protein